MLGTFKKANDILQKIDKIYKIHNKNTKSKIHRHTKSFLIRCSSTVSESEMGGGLAIVKRDYLILHSTMQYSAHINQVWQLLV